MNQYRDLSEFLLWANDATSPMRYTKVIDTEEHIERLVSTAKNDKALSYDYKVEPILVEPDFNGHLDAAFITGIPKALVDSIYSHFDRRLAFIASCISGRSDEFVRAQRLLFPAFFADNPASHKKSFWHRCSSKELIECSDVNVSAEEAVAKVQDALRIKSLDWSVKLKGNMRSLFAVNSSQRCVKVNRTAVFSPEVLNSIIRHEVGGHVFRWEQSWRQSIALMSVPLGDYFTSEEGLAVWLETQDPWISAERVQTFISRVDAVGWALEMGIIPLIRQICDSSGLNLVDSARIALRVKRGLHDWNEPGAFVKDALYVIGCNLVEQLSDAEREIMWTNKWGIDLLPVIKAEPDFFGEN